MRAALITNQVKKLQAKKNRSQSPRKGEDEDDVQNMLQRKLNKGYQQPSLYTSAERRGYYPNGYDDDSDQYIYQNSIRPYQQMQDFGTPTQVSPRRKKFSLKNSNNRKRLDFNAHDDDDEDEDYYDQQGPEIQFVEQEVNPPLLKP